MTQQPVQPVRVRLAPSPTGTPHIGTMRQAIFDWLLARNTGGTFILRIEDTDRRRFVPTALEGIYASLRWLGLDWDEGPDIGGPHAPYFQSERLDLYQTEVRRLIAANDAYECFCTPERLDTMRNRQRELKQPPHYDGRCRSEEGRAEAKRDAGAGAASVVRFAMPDTGQTVVPDFVRGDLSFENARLDDAVLLKSDGFPTYHLAMPVDDHEMAISHVIRNEEWLPSAPLHKRLFDALGYPLPVFVHTASILGSDRAKLSKRHGAQSVLEYRDQGYLPEAVFNFLGLLGWSLDDKTEVISRDEFVQHFSIERLIKSPAVFDLEKLNWMNGHYLRSLPPEDVTGLLTDWLERPEAAGGLPDQVERPLDFDYTLRLVPLVRERVKLLSEARDMMAFFYLPDGVEPDPAMLLGKAFAGEPRRAADLLSEALVLAEGVEAWTAEAIEAAYRALAEQQSVRAGELFMLVRVATTGRSVAPPLFETMELVGRERCVLRLRLAINLL